MATRERRNWADDDDDDLANDTQGFSSKPDKDGIMTITSYKTVNGKNVKVTKRVRQTSKVIRTNRAVAERAKMRKFGDAADKEPEECRPAACDETSFEIPKKADVVKTEADADAEWDFFDLSSGAIVKESAKAGGVWSKYRKEKQEADGTAEKKEEEKKEGGEEEKKTKYVPPSLRNKEAAANARSLEQQQRDECTLRVTNLAEDVSQNDLQELFSRVARVQRIFLAKSKDRPNQSKGFAFVTYYNKSDAAKAIDALHGHGYENLILKVEWAKPSGKEGGKP